MRFLPTSVHSVIDYLAVAVLFALPRLLGWSAEVTSLLTLAAGVTLIYSLLTRYELGLLKLLPMVGHLTLDAVSGLILLSAPWLGVRAPGNQHWWLVGLGLFELMAALVTRTEPSYLRTAHRVPPEAAATHPSGSYHSASYPAADSSDASSAAGLDQVVTDQNERAAESADRLAANSEPLNESVADRERRAQ